MTPALLYSAGAAVVVVLLGVLLYLMFNGAKVAQARQARRYRVLGLKSEERAIHIRTDRHLWQAQLREARQEQTVRHTARRQELNAWQREYYSGY